MNRILGLPPIGNGPGSWRRSPDASAQGWRPGKEPQLRSMLKKNGLAQDIQSKLQPVLEGSVSLPTLQLHGIPQPRAATKDHIHVTFSESSRSCSSLKDTRSSWPKTPHVSPIPFEETPSSFDSRQSDHDQISHKQPAWILKRGQWILDSHKPLSFQEELAQFLESEQKLAGRKRYTNGVATPGYMRRYVKRNPFGGFWGL
eukprot:gnl/MRDRNA2_/MRDRNA2_95632_c0_seq1.p1 gnl/MRDRNA2_/MRDRNA2_95632_c0~~gnl/MRDRNA2_/MRDRNA2_95632_c0_seq1.p1  ORF type:complete len:201 (+),score=28.60 gnl/MRDRNA2_/MRDRNA2_95632_c0_seq1:145-747(+)